MRKNKSVNYFMFDVGFKNLKNVIHLTIFIVNHLAIFEKNLKKIR